MMTGREIILERIRTNKPEQKPLPDGIADQNKTQSVQELVVEFTESLRKAGAIINEFASMQQATEYFDGNFPNSVNLLNPEIKGKYAKETSNEELEKTEMVIMEGQFGVAENGAVWVDEANFPHRLLPFVTRQLVLVLDRSKIVSTMHEAYQRLDLREIGFGVFISGPSKTADIEQSLVYGAHGAKETIIIIYRK